MPLGDFWLSVRYSPGGLKRTSATSQPEKVVLTVYSE